MLRKLALSLLLLAASDAARAAGPPRSAILDLLRSDGCEDVAGYREFRSALRKAVDDRDVSALQQLFHPRGSMRVHGVHMTAAAADADPARFEPVWNELRDILRRGCARNGTRLILPGVARLAEGDLATETLISIRPTSLYRRPSQRSRLARIGVGRILTEVVHDERWTRVRLGKVEGFVPTADVRNPYDTRIEAERVDGRWTIIEFGSGV